MVADRHAGHNDRAAADPDVVSDYDRSRLRFAEGKRAVCPGCAEPLARAGGVKRGIDLHVRRNQRIVADDDPVVVQKRAAHVHFAVVAEVNVVPIIHIEGRRDPQVCAAPAQQLRQNAVLFREIVRIRQIVIAHQLFRLVPLRQQLRVAAVINRACQHFFAFRHCIDLRNSECLRCAACFMIAYGAAFIHRFRS